MSTLRQVCQLNPDAAFVSLFRVLNADSQDNLQILSGVLCHVGNSRRDKLAFCLEAFWSEDAGLHG